MQARAPSGSTGFVGRDVERAVLRDALSAAENGAATAVLVHGEAGVGKTRLVDEVSQERSGFTVLRGRCLQLASVSMPYLPFVSAFEGWLGTASANERQAVLEAAPALTQLVPSLGGQPTEAGEHLTTIDRALAVLAARQPLILIVDDVQWADPSSRDVVYYVLAGQRGRTAILMTMRDEQQDEADPMIGWLADLRRLPTLRELALDRLTRDETAEQAALALGREPDPDLVADLVDRTGGNAYFNELLLRDSDLATGQLDTGTPAALRDALLTSWHRLSPTAREVTRMLAIAGRPGTADLLTRATAPLDVPAGGVLPALREATAGGVLEVGDGFWFRHPLLAEVLRETLLPDERVERHRLLAEVLVAEAPGAVAQGDLARHHEGAGQLDEAFTAYLAAADDAAAVAAYAEEGELLMRAWRLRHRVTPEVVARHGSAIELAARVAFGRRRGGNELEAALLLDEARAEEAQEPDPLVRARFLRLWSQLGPVIGNPLGSDATHQALEQALDLCRARPPGAEYAHVLAELSYSFTSRGDVPSARAAIEEAVEVSRSVGDAFVLGYALGARSAALDVSGDPEGAERDAEEGYRVAVASGRADAIALAAAAHSDLLERHGRWAEGAQLDLDAHRAALTGGARGLGQRLGGFAAIFLCHIGRLAEAEAVLTRVMSFRLSGASAIVSRQAALVLAVRQGRMTVAESHAVRLQELDPGIRSVGLRAQAAWCEYAVAAGRPREALDVLAEQVAGDAVRLEPHFGDELLMWAARAAAALATEDQDAAVATLDALLESRAALEPQPFADVATNRVRAAWLALFTAESALVRGADDPETAWREAVTATRDAGLRVEHARALLALSRLAAARGRRAEAAAALREARTLAVELGAGALVEQADALARIARIPTAEPAEAEAAASPALDRAGLTAREREVLSHLVAGRTYAEIAAALFISEKTVSVHVSNVLRKTGTTNRVDAATWAERAASTASLPSSE